eukprot:6286225-Heterocapsa_arctica.AAC.1
MALQLQEEPRPGGVPGDRQIPGKWDPEQNDGRRAGADRSRYGGSRCAQRDQGPGNDDRGDDEEDRGHRQREHDDR